MSIGDRLGIAGLILGLIGIALMYLWPNKKWIGWVALISAMALGVAWSVAELTNKISVAKHNELVEKPPSAPAPAPVIQTQIKGVCQEVADGSQLMKWSGKYKVGFVCGLDDPTRDKLDDDRISISQAFTIHPGNIQMAVRFSPLMQGEISRRWKSIGNEVIPAGSVENMVPPGLPMITWSEKVLFSKTTKVSDIHRLSDIPRHGGVILSQGFPLTEQ